MSSLPDPSEFAPSADALWAMYRNARARAATARDLLRARLARGVPAVVPMTNGEPWASAAVANQEVRRLIDAYCRADKALEDAARTLVDCLELRDDGRGEGVVFTLEMAPKEGAR